MTRALDADRDNLMSQLRLMLSKEFRISLVQSSLLMIIAFIRVLIEFPDDIGSAVAISLATGTVVFISVFLGILFSVGIDHLGLDPAAGSAPLLTTVSDILGITTLCCCAYIILG